MDLPPPRQPRSHACSRRQCWRSVSALLLVTLVMSGVSGRELRAAVSRGRHCAVVAVEPAAPPVAPRGIRPKAEVRSAAVTTAPVVTKRCGVIESRRSQVAGNPAIEVRAPHELSLPPPGEPA